MSKLGINPGQLSLLLNFEEDQAPLRDSSGTGYIIDSTIGRYDLCNDDCKRGGGCFEMMRGGAPESAPVKVPCLKVAKDFTFTAWLKTRDTATAQTFLFYGFEYPRDFFLSCQVSYGQTPVVLCDNSTGEEVPGVETEADTALLESGTRHGHGQGQGRQKRGASAAEGGSRSGDNEEDSWNHVAVTRSILTGDVKMYWNGEEKNSINFGKQEWLSDNSNFVVGAKPGHPEMDFSGWIDEVGVWKRVLSPNEIRQIERQTNAFTSNELYSVVGKLELLLDFEDTADAPLDTSGNDYGVQRSEEGATWSTSDCQRGEACLLLAGNEASRYPLVVPCLRLQKHWSFTAWLKTNSHSRDQNAFFYGNEYPASYTFYCHVLYEQRGVLCEGPGDFGQVDTLEDGGGGALPMNEGEWHHFAVTRNAMTGLVSIYWDGQMVTSKSLQAGYMPRGDTDLPAPKFYIGDIVGQTEKGFEGYVDEVSAWSRVLSSTEVGGLMGSTGPYG